ncbi:MAG: cytochrome c [Agriterribacter sp.]
MQKSYLVFVFCICATIITKAQSVTYKDVEPIFFQKCVACHRSGDAAPFSLTNYNDVVKRLSFIKEVLEKNYMPPWKADVHYRDFANNRMLSEEQKNTILKWIENKAPKGNYKEKEQEQRNALLATTAVGRKPDLTFKIDSPFVVKGDNTERFIIFKIPFEFEDIHNVEAIEFYCNNKKIIHHINYGFYEVQDPNIDIRGGRSYLNATEDDRSAPDPFILLNRKMTYYTGWIPGTSYENYPKDFGWVLPKRGVLLLTTHYSATAVDESSVVGVNIFFRKEPVKREVKVISFGSGGVGENDIYPKLLLYPGKISTHHLRVKTSGDQSLLAVSASHAFSW